MTDVTIQNSKLLRKLEEQRAKYADNLALDFSLSLARYAAFHDCTNDECGVVFNIAMEGFGKSVPLPIIVAGALNEVSPGCGPE